MKSYAIYDKALNRTTPVGYLFYYEKAASFIIELCDDLDEWDAPLLFQKLVKEKRYTVPANISHLWVSERIIPSGRQNIGTILKNHRLSDYDEMSLLRLSRGKCAQDDCYISEIAYADIPQSITDRTKNNIRECFPTEDSQLLCLFNDNTAKKVDFTTLIDKYSDLSYVIVNKALLDSVKVGVGGYSAVFNDSIEIPSVDLYAHGILLPLTSNDFYNFIHRNVMDTTATYNMLQCSRQNLSYMVREEKITPIIYGTKENLYLKGEVERVMSE